MSQKEIILKLLDFLHSQVISSGGDGDALWYTEYFTLDFILPMLEEYNNNLKFKWGITLKDGYISWGEGQEGVIITDREDIYKNAPEFQECIVRY